MSITERDFFLNLFLFVIFIQHSEVGKNWKLTLPRELGS